MNNDEKVFPPDMVVVELKSAGKTQGAKGEDKSNDSVEKPDWSKLPPEAFNDISQVD